MRKAIEAASNSKGNYSSINDSDDNGNNARYFDDVNGNDEGIANDSETYSYAQNIHNRTTLPIDDDETSSTYAQNIQSGASSPTDDDDVVPIVSPSETTRTYSRRKVRVLLPLITAMYFCNVTIRPVIFQYLIERWSIEAGHNTSVSSGGSLCDRNESDPAAKEADAIQSRVADISVYCTWCTTGPALLTCLVFGTLVDLIGRKPAHLISQVGTTLQVLTVVFIMRFDLNTDFMYLAYAFDGVGGSYMLYLVANLSSTADVSDSKKSRILWITIVLTLSHASTSAADVAMGQIVKHFGYVAAALTVLAPVALSLLLSIFVLPETLPTKRQNISLKKVWEHNSRVLFLYTRDGSRETRLSLFFSLLIFFTYQVTRSSLSTTDTLYQKHEPLCWTSVTIGYYAAFSDITRATLGLLFLWITRRIGCARDEVVSMVTALFLAGGFVMEAFARNDWEMFMAPVISIPSANISPITRGVMSFLVGPEKQGVMFSSVALVEVFCVLISQTAYSKVYSATVDFMPGAVYFVLTATSLVVFILYIPFFYFYERPPKKYEKL